MAHVYGQRSWVVNSWPWKLKVKVMAKVTFEALSSIDMFAFHFVAIGPILAEIEQIPYLTLKIEGQSHGQGQTQWSHLRPMIQSICVLYVSWQSDHFGLRCSKFYIWPWKFKVKVAMKIDQNLIRQYVRAINPAKRNPYSCSEVISWRKVCGWQQPMNRYKNV